MTPFLRFIHIVMIVMAIVYLIKGLERTWVRMKKLKEYEEAFARHKEANIKLQEEDPQASHFIPLPDTFKHHDDLSSLCKQCITIALKGTRFRLPEGGEPSVRVINLRFFVTKTPKGPIRVEAIECGSRYVIIGAEDPFSGYVLTDYDFDRTMYGIVTKFQLQRTSPEDVETHTSEVKADNKAD